jgi:DNA polymerase epsilon subunit 1
MAFVEKKEFEPAELARSAFEIREKIDTLIEKGESFREKPLIYHLDVAAMYPNIILTNRL